MRTSIRVPARKPRNHLVVVLAILARAGGRHALRKRAREKDRKDLDQRVREGGEW